MGEVLKLLYDAMQEYNSPVTIYISLADKDDIAYYRIHVNDKHYIGQIYRDSDGQFWRKGERPEKNGE